VTLQARLRRIGARLRDLFARLFRRAKAPGRFETGRARSWRGFVTTAPRVEPTRDYVVYVPAGWSRWRRARLLVLLHGCRQTAEDLAGLTRIVDFADARGMLVLMPRQTAAANEWSCWNWFEANTEHGAGEAAIVAAQIVQVRRRYRARRERVWVAGLSAGGALAAIIGLRHPRLVHGVLVHSGLACGAASSPAAVMRVMREGPDTSVVRVANDAYVAQRRNVYDVPLVVIHGDRDDIVSPRNADALVAQYLQFNRLVRGEGGAADNGLPPAFASARTEEGNAHSFRIDDWLAGARLAVRRVVVDGLAHAWSGGNNAYAFADPRGPDALGLLADFIRDIAQAPIAHAPDAHAPD
jgi:poly(hydroxyalkanoate) depolymerase family esterase